ncbi:hypothetical protein Tco_0862220 [Tanacetum coccineum]
MDGLDAMLENVCVKLYVVPVTAFSEDDLSSIATKLGTPLMLDSYISDMCMQSWGRSIYVRAMIELRADVELKDNIVAAMPKITGEEECPKNIGACATKNLKKTSENPKGISVGQEIGFKPTKQIEKLIIDEEVSLVDDEEKPLEKIVYSGVYDNEDEVASVYNEMASFLAMKDDYVTTADRVTTAEGLQLLMDKDCSEKR